MTRRIDKLQINALNASNNQILVVRGGQLSFDAPANVFATSGSDLSGNTTIDLQEGSNLYYTNARVQSHLDAGGYQTAANILANVVTEMDLSGNTTTDLSEGINLYYTNDRVYSNVSPLLDLKANVYDLTTANVVELDNLYYTNASVQAYLDESGYQTAANILANVLTEINLSGNTSNDLNEGENLYYTNDRVRSAFTTGEHISIESNGTIRANLVSVVSDILPETTETYDLGSPNKKWKDLYLSGNTLYIGDATVGSIGNTIVMNALEVINRGDLYTGGRNIIISNEGEIDTNADPSDFYDITIDNEITQILSNNMDLIFTTPATPGYRYLVRSIVLTNVSNTDVTFNANVFYNGNTYIYANAFTIPYGFTTDLIEKPEVLMPNTQVRMSASSNNAITAHISYKRVEDITYSSEYEKVTASNTFQTVFINSSASIIESVKISNRTDQTLRGTLMVVDANDNLKTYLASNTLLAKNFYSELLVNPILMATGYKLRFAYYNGQANAITTFISSRTTETYDVTANTLVLNEGQAVRFTIDTTNIQTGTERYFRTLGNVSSSDFLEGNTGSFVVFNNQGNVTLTANSDLSTNEPTESFRLQLLLGSTNGELVYTSDKVVIVNDTSNLVGVQSVTESSSNIEETQAVTFTVRTTDADGLGNTLLYYTITGNADIFGGNSGSFAVNNDVANLELIPESTSSGEIKLFSVEIRRNSTTGNILFTSNTITVNPYRQDLLLTATGGNDIFNITDNSDYRVHVFKSSNNFTISRLSPVSPVNKIDFVIIGGGGGGHVGGGGGGGFLNFSNVNITSTENMVVTVGGGATAPPSRIGGTGSGGSSRITISSLPVPSTTARGGGNGGGMGTSPSPFPQFDSRFAGSPGGSGGGGGGFINKTNLPYPANAAAGGPGDQGNPGGNARAVAFPHPFNGIKGGGGGGAGAPGDSEAPEYPPFQGSDGGIGLQIPWLPASYGESSGSATRYFAGGGGGGGSITNPAPVAIPIFWGQSSGGLGGGGQGTSGNPDTTQVSYPGDINTGGGGGGTNGAVFGAGKPSSGGSGFVVVRYPILLGTANSRISKVLTVTSNITSINSNTSVRFNIITEKSSNAEVLYFDTSANVSNTTFVQGNTGSFTVNGNVGTITLTTRAEPTSRTFRLQVRRGSTTGTILASSNVLTYTGI